MKKRPKVNDAIWIKDDQLIAAAVIGEERQNQVKIYNSEYGEILYALSGHREHIRCLKMHPIYNHVIISTGKGIQNYTFSLDFPILPDEEICSESPESIYKPIRF